SQIQQHSAATQHAGRNRSEVNLQSAAQAVTTPNRIAVFVDGRCSQRVSTKALAAMKTATGMSVYANPVNARIGGKVVKKTTASKAAISPASSRVQAYTRKTPKAKNGPMPKRARANVRQ